MQRWVTGFLAVALVGLPVRAGGEIHGTVHTERGESFTGPIRWDVNENFWDDTLDASKRERVKQKEEGYRIRFFGLRVGPDDSWVTHGFSIPFGGLRGLERVDSETADLLLKNGERIRVVASGSDIGSGMRSLVVEDPQRGVVDVSWSMLTRVEFRPAGGPGRDARRLWGTVETGSESLTGFIVWDRDESLLEDIIDGNDGERDREIPFGEIRAIERRGSRGSLVTLRDGKQLQLTGTNDIDDGHRGVMVRVPDTGVAEVRWDRVRRVTFADPPPSPAYDAFDVGRRLQGTVTTTAGAVRTGRVVWDRDEQWNWETVDGERDDIYWSIPFSRIASIAPARDRAEVRLSDGRVLVLEGTNDVNEENKGIVVSAADGGEVTLEWGEIATVAFHE